MICVAPPPAAQLEPPLRVSQGALWCARRSISDFASLVPKFYSDFLSRVSTLVLQERTSYLPADLGTLGIPRNP